MEVKAGGFRELVGQASHYLEKLYGTKDLDSLNTEELDMFFVSNESARALFVALLTGEWSLEEEPASMLVDSIKSNCAVSSEVLVKNLAMSCAMAWHHERNEDLKMAKESTKVNERTKWIIEKAMNPSLKESLDELSKAIELKLENDEDPNNLFCLFIDRWQYDISQLEVMKKVISSLDLES